MERYEPLQEETETRPGMLPESGVNPRLYAYEITPLVDKGFDAGQAAGEFLDYRMNVPWSRPWSRLCESVEGSPWAPAGCSPEGRPARFSWLFQEVKVARPSRVQISIA